MNVGKNASGSLLAAAVIRLARPSTPDSLFRSFALSLRSYLKTTSSAFVAVQQSA
jgi:hypothetical protein